MLNKLRIIKRTIELYLMRLLNFLRADLSLIIKKTHHLNIFIFMKAAKARFICEFFEYKYRERNYTPVDFVISFFGGRKQLFFIDVGAYDGVANSNTFTLESKYNWSGICLEPNPLVFKKLIESRKCQCYNLGAYSKETPLTFWQINSRPNTEQLSGFERSFHSKHLDRIKQELLEYGGSVEKLEVKSITLDSILNLSNIDKKVDYLSIDTEGSELEVLKGIDLSRKNITLISCEDNYGVKEITEYLSGFGYIKLLKVCIDVFYFKLF